MRYHFFFILCFVYFFDNSNAQSGEANRVITPHINPTLRFTENLGQWNQNILFRAQLDGGALYLETNSLTFNFYDKKKYRALHHGGILKKEYSDLDIKGHAYKISFEGANPDPQIEKLQQGSDYENFFIGNDESKWKGNVRNYQQVFLKNLYNGINYEVLTTARGIKYNFHVSANANPSDIKLRYEGVEDIKLKDGVLFLKLNVNEVVEQKPYAYQLISGIVKKVPCNYRLKDKILSFDFPKGYEKNYELVIDPILVFAAQSGSAADNFGMTATFDHQGNLYSGGTVFSIGYPVTLGAYSTSFNGPTAPGNTDVVITKYNSNGNALIYSTYLGGAGAEVISSLIVDQSSNLCFYGATGSANFPVTVGAYDVSFNGGQPLSFVFNGTNFTNGTDIYIGKFNSTGSALLGCTYLGGSRNDGVNHVNVQTPLPPPNPPILEFQSDSLQFNYGDQYRGEIQLDVIGNIYIASSTRSSNFPIENGFDNTLGGKQDGILAKFNPNLTSLMYSSYIGGSSNDAGYGLLVRNNFEVYVTGGTCSNDFSYVPGGYQASYQGGIADGYIIRVSPTGTAVLNNTFFGTSSYDQTYFIQTDRYNDIYVYGQSTGNIPILAAANESTVFSVPNTHQFISRLDETLNTLNLSTVFGNYTSQTDISPCAFSVDKCNNIYISGWGGNIITGNSPVFNMPLANATQANTNGFDFYFMGLDSNATSLQYGSYFGGGFSQEHVDGGTSRFDPFGRIYQSVCAGCGGNDDFPVTPGAWPCTSGPCTGGLPNASFNCNNGVIKLDFQLQLTISTINTATQTGCVPFVATFTAGTLGPNTNYLWYLGNGVTSATINSTATYTNPGTYTIALVTTNSTTCNKKDSAITYITVLPAPMADFSYTVIPCTNSIVTINTSTGSLGSNPYLWNFGNSVTSTLTAPSYVYPLDGSYNISLTVKDVNGCTNSVSKPLSVFNFTPGIANGNTICNGETTTLNAAGGVSYTWTPATNLNNAFTSSPTANPTTSTIYTVTIFNNTFGNNCIASLTTQVLVNPTPTANFNFSVNPCGGGVYFNDLSASDITNWSWILSSTKTSTLQNPYNFYYSGGTHTVQLITTNIYGCKNTFTNVLVVPVPPPVAISSPTDVCKGSSVQLSASGGTAYAWSPAQLVDLPFAATTNATPLVNTDFSVVITTTKTVNGSVCEFLLTTFVNVSQLSTVPVRAQADPTIVIVGNSTTLTYLGDPGALVTWYPIGSTTPVTGYVVTAKPDKITTYTAVATKGACREDPEVRVEAYTARCIDTDAFVPNTFTPNNDGQNDIFIVRGLKVDEVYFAVYNRWGELVFETNDKTKGWDGIYKNKPADVGVFGWYLKVKCFNGEETFKKGNVTLVR